MGQWGTLVDPPAHFVRGLKYFDEIGVKAMILPLAIIAAIVSITYAQQITALAR